MSSESAVHRHQPSPSRPSLSSPLPSHAARRLILASRRWGSLSSSSQPRSVLPSCGGQLLRAGNGHRRPAAFLTGATPPLHVHLAASTPSQCCWATVPQAAPGIVRSWARQIRPRGRGPTSCASGLHSAAHATVSLGHGQEISPWGLDSFQFIFWYIQTYCKFKNLYKFDLMSESYEMNFIE
jgi:hypothetical protein